MVKKSSRIKYGYKGEQLNLKEIYSRNKKRRSKSKYLLSVNIMLGKKDPVPAKIVCVRNKAIVRTGLHSYAQIRSFPRKRASVFMANAGRSKYSSRPANQC